MRFFTEHIEKILVGPDRHQCRKGLTEITAAVLDSTPLGQLYRSERPVIGEEERRKARLRDEPLTLPICPELPGTDARGCPIDC